MKKTYQIPGYWLLILIINTIVAQIHTWKIILGL